MLSRHLFLSLGLVVVAAQYLVLALGLQYDSAGLERAVFWTVEFLSLPFNVLEDVLHWLTGGTALLWGHKLGAAAVVLGLLSYIDRRRSRARV